MCGLTTLNERPSPFQDGRPWNIRSMIRSLLDSDRELPPLHTGVQNAPTTFLLRLAGFPAAVFKPRPFLVIVTFG